MADKATITLVDEKHKASSMTINVVEATGINFDTIAANVATLETAVRTLSESAHSRRLITTTDNTGTVVDDGGVRGNKAIIRWFSALENEGEGANGSNEVGCIDKSLFTLSGSKLLLVGANYDALKTAFDAVATSENGHPVSVYEVEFVTRNIN